MSIDLGEHQEDLASSFEKSASAVRVYADRFERSYGRPALKACMAAFDVYPVSSTFLAIFALLSLFPVLLFIGASLFVVVSFTFIALACAIGGSVIVELFLLSAILIYLTGTFIVSLFLTTGVIATYLVVRLAILVRTEGLGGLSAWANEIKQHFIQKNATTNGHRRRRSEGSSGDSAILVKREFDGETSDLSKSPSGFKMEGEF